MNRMPLRYELLVNGEKISVAGVKEYGFLTGIVSWVKRSPENITTALRAREGFDETEFLQEACEVSVTGFDSASQKHFQWAQRALKPGDEVTIRILSPGEFDEPQSSE